MKKILIIILSIIILFVLTIGSIFIYKEIINNKFNSDEYLIKVMNSEVPFIDENGIETIYKDYIFYNKPYDKLTKYSFVDLDVDGLKELVTYVETNPAVDAYMVFRYNEEEKKVYGYMFGIREFQMLKSDGTFCGSGGAGTNGYYKINFEQNEKILNEIAYVDNIFKEYRINNQPVSKEEAVDYVDKWYNRENCNWESERINQKTQ